MSPEEKEIKDNCKKSYVDDDLEATIVFLGWLADRITNSTRHVDTQANIVVGLSTGVFILAMNELVSTDKFHFALILVAIFSAISAILALCAIRPFEFMVQRGHEESMFFSRMISKHKSAKEYSKELVNALKSDEEIFYQFGIEIYNLSRYYYRPKRTLYAYSRNIFLLGVLISAAALLGEWLRF